MTRLKYLLRSLVWYRKSHLATVLGAATATAVLAGAMLTGLSVRRSLRSLAEARLGAAEWVLSSRGFFRSQIAEEFRPAARSCALITQDGALVYESSGRRAAVTVYGVDDSFYQFNHAQAKAPAGRDALLSPALAAELGAKAGENIAIRVEEFTAIPREFLLGRKDDTSHVLRMRVADGVTPAAVADFSLRPQQGDVRAVFVPLERMQRELKITGKANTVLLAGATGDQLARLFQERFRLDDAGLRLHKRPQGQDVVLEHDSTILDDRTAETALQAAKSMGILARPSLVYLANSIRTGKRSIPYSLVVAVDMATLGEVNGDRPLPKTRKPPVVLNDWAASDLEARQGDTVTFDYFVWSADGHLGNGSAEFEVASITPIRGMAADREFAPVYPGITDQKSLADWDPPFPIDLKRVRPRDEEYWKQYRTTPKAWVPLDTGRKLWGTRFGSYTSIRFLDPDSRLEKVLRAETDPLSGQFTLLPVRQQSLDASAGSTDFGEYFTYFSVFVLAAALILMALFFRLGVEQRRGEAGLLRALGASDELLRRFFLAEGLAVAAAGALIGALCAPAYTALIVQGLRTWWRDATGTRLLRLSADPGLLAVGAIGGTVMAGLAIWYTLRRWEGLSPAALSRETAAPEASRRLKAATFVLLLSGAGFLLLPASRLVPAAAAFFGAGVSLLAGALCAAAWWLKRPPLELAGIPGTAALVRLALRNAAWRPGRTMACLALIAPAVFLLVAMEAFRHGSGGDTAGFGLYAESQTPLVYDPNTPQGADRLNLQGLPKLRWVSFRLKPGDDISCLNLYQPRNPRILGVPEAFIQRNAFRFAGSTGETAETRAQPWLQLEAQLNSGVIPAIVDQNSLTYVLHRKLGDEFEMEREGAQPLRLKIVAALQGSLFQSEILISEKNFMRLFPQIGGARVFLIDGSPEMAGPLEDALSAYGFDAQPAAERLAGYFRVENTYLSMFQALGGFGLLLGTVGLAAVVLRNALERGRELALLRAAGFDHRLTEMLMMFETGAIVTVGSLAGAFCAMLAVAPAVGARGFGWPALRVGSLLVLIIAGGLAATWAAVRVAGRGVVAAALRRE